MRVRTDMGIEQIGLAILDNPVSILKIGLAFANRLNLSAPERNTCLKFVQQEVIMSSRAIHRGVSVAGGDRLPRLSFLRRWIGGLTLLPGHTFSYESSC
jgi:hypothetical protein